MSASDIFLSDFPTIFKYKRRGKWCHHAIDAYLAPHLTPSMTTVLHAVVSRTADWVKETEVITTNSMINGVYDRTGRLLHAPILAGYSTIEKAIGELVELGFISTQVKHWKEGCNPVRHVTLHTDKLLLAGYNAANFSEKDYHKMTETVSHLKVPKSVRRATKAPYSTQFLFKQNALRQPLKTPKFDANVVRYVNNDSVIKTITSEEKNLPQSQNPFSKPELHSIVVEPVEQALSEVSPTPILEDLPVTADLPVNDNRIIEVNQRLNSKKTVEAKVLQVIANRASRVNKRIAQKDSYFPTKDLFKEMWENAMREFAPEAPIGILDDLSYYKFRACMGIKKGEKQVSMQDRFGFSSMEEFLQFCITDWSRVTKKYNRDYAEPTPNFAQLPGFIRILMPAFIAHKVGKKKIKENTAAAIKRNNERMTEIENARIAEMKERKEAIAESEEVMALRARIAELELAVIRERANKDTMREYAENPNKYLEENGLEPMMDIPVLPEWEELQKQAEMQA